MLKYQEIIEKLTTEQKLTLLADISSLDGEHIAELGLTCIKEASAESVNQTLEAESCPSFAGLVNSWNARLVSEVADTLAKEAKRQGVTLLQTPSANVRSTPYSSGVSEDPHLCGTLAGVYAATGKRTGVKTYVADPALTQEDADCSDLKPDPRAIREYFQKPFDIICRYGVGALKTSRPSVEGAYENVNAEWLKKYENKIPIIYDCASAQDLLQIVREGNRLCRKGSYRKLKEALDKYKELREAFEAGQISLNELEAECRNGGALDPETVDEALDRVIDFTFSCKNAKATVSAPAATQKRGKAKPLALRAAEESIVLLKNENKCLPLKKRRSVALIGDLASESERESMREVAQGLAKNKKLKLLGYARGYDIERDRSDELLAEAVSLAKRADTIVVVLGYREKDKERAMRNGTSKLPANQLALLEAVAKGKKTKAKLVAVVAGERYPDMKFDGVCQATLFAPLDGGKSAQALWNVLTGKTNPSGKLAVSCYEDTDGYFENLQAYKRAKRNKIGTFYGYRHYDSSGLRVKYPFGHGLSYTKFKYSALKCAGGLITFKVKNKGRYAGSEIAQIYIGKRSSGVISPKKELKAFAKVELRRGAKRKVRLEIKNLDLGVWDERKKKYVTEMTTYEAYVAASCADVRLTKSFVCGSEGVTRSKERYSDYLQTYSNIQTGQYYLELPIRLRKEKKDRLRKFMLGASVFTLCLDLAYLYFRYVRWLPKTWWVYVIAAAANILPMGLTALLTVKQKQRINKYREINMNEKKKKRDALKVEDLAEELPYEQLFLEEFSAVVKTAKTEQASETAKETKSVLAVPFDRDFTLKVACEEFVTFTHERGVEVDAFTAKRLFAAFAASRLVVLKCADEVLLKNFLPLLGEYFGAQLGVDGYSEEIAAEDGLLYRRNGRGELVLTNAGTALTDRSRSESDIRVLAFRGGRSAALKPLLAPVIRFLDQPDRETQISIRAKAGESALYDVAEATWFVIAMESAEKLTDIPKYILDMASVVDLQLKPGLGAKLVELPSAADGNAEGESKETVEIDVSEIEKTPIKRLTYPQFKKLVENACRECQLDEVLWKRIDKLEDYVKAYGEYHIENKLWQRIERFVSTYLALGGEAEEALDCMMAQHIVYGMLPVLVSAKKSLEERFSHTLENVCGEGHVPNTLKAVKEEELDV